MIKDVVVHDWLLGKPPGPSSARLTLIRIRNEKSAILVQTGAGEPVPKPSVSGTLRAVIPRFQLSSVYGRHFRQVFGTLLADFVHSNSHEQIGTPMLAKLVFSIRWYTNAHVIEFGKGDSMGEGAGELAAQERFP